MEHGHVSDMHTDSSRPLYRSCAMKMNPDVTACHGCLVVLQRARERRNRTHGFQLASGIDERASGQSWGEPDVKPRVRGMTCGVARDETPRHAIFHMRLAVTLHQEMTGLCDNREQGWCDALLRSVSWHKAPDIRLLASDSLRGEERCFAMLAMVQEGVRQLASQLRRARKALRQAKKDPVRSHRTGQVRALQEYRGRQGEGRRSGHCRI